MKTLSIPRNATRLAVPALVAAVGMMAATGIGGGHHAAASGLFFGSDIRATPGWHASMGTWGVYNFTVKNIGISDSMNVRAQGTCWYVGSAGVAAAPVYPVNSPLQMGTIHAGETRSLTAVCTSKGSYSSVGHKITVAGSDDIDPTNNTAIDGTVLEAAPTLVQYARFVQCTITDNWIRPALGRATATCT